MTTTTSTGHALSAAGWLETHSLAGQPEYEAMVRTTDKASTDALTRPTDKRMTLLPSVHPAGYQWWPQAIR